MILVRMNHRELTTESKRTKLSIIRFYQVCQLRYRMLGCNEASYLIAFFQKHLIIFTERNAKDNGCHVFEAMDPFLSLTALAAHIKHAIAG